MSSNDWRPIQGCNPAAGVDSPPAGSGDCRAHLLPEERSRIVDSIFETLKKHLPVSHPDGLNELHKIAVRFERRICDAATSQYDYLRKIALKMLSMKMPTQQAPGNTQVIPNQYNFAPGLSTQGSNQAHTTSIPLMSQQQAWQPKTCTSVQASSLTHKLPVLNQTNMDQIQAQAGLKEISSSTTADSTAHAGDYWQEEIYQMIKVLKVQYFAELSELYNKISVKLEHVESNMPPQMPPQDYDTMKSFKVMLDRILQMLQIWKSRVQPAMRDRVPQYEKHIISILNLQRKPVQPQIQH